MLKFILSIMVSQTFAIGPYSGNPDYSSSARVYVTNSSLPVTVTGTVSTTGGALATNQVTEIGKLTDIYNKLVAGIAVTSTTTVSGSLGRSWSLSSGTDSVSAALTGTLPAFASTPTFNLGTLNGAATSSLQTSANTFLSSIESLLSGTLSVSGTVGISGTVPVSGTFWPTTQPISAASLPLPSGASTSALQTTSNASLSSIDSKLSGTIAVSGLVAIGGTVPVSQSGSWSVAVNNFPTTQAVSGTITANQGGTWTTGRSWNLSSASDSLNVGNFPSTYPVTGSFWQTTQPVSAASLPLPSGASTSAKQPSLGTAGSASSDVITVQGITSMTALKVDGSGAIQPVTGTFFQATQPVSLASVPTHAVTGTFFQATQPVSIATMPSTPVTGTFFQATQPVSIASLPAITGTVSTKNDLSPNGPTVATVGVASASAVSSNASRKGLVLTNNSANKIYLGFGTAAIIGSGILLLPGGVFTMDEYTYDTGAINAIASAASSSMAIQEFQ